MNHIQTATAFCLNCKSPVHANGDALFDTRFGIATPYSIALCPDCGLEQIMPWPTCDELEVLYETYYNFGGEKGDSNSRYVLFRKLFQNSWWWDLWLKFDGDISFHAVPGNGRLLDVGCNEGRGLIRYQRSGFSVEGLELNSKAAETARSKGFTVYGSTLEGFVSDKKYDVIVLSNVLEHSLNPGIMLQHIHRLLNPGGQVWISCPNSRSWLRSVFGRYWINWHVPFHVVHFSPDTLTGILKKSQFEIVSIRQETPALWVSHSIIARLFAQAGQPTRQLRSAALVATLILLIRGLLFPLLWLGNYIKRGDCLVVVACKSQAISNKTP